MTNRVCGSCHSVVDSTTPVRTITGTLLERCDTCLNKTNAARKNPDFNVRDFRPAFIKGAKSYEDRLKEKGYTKVDNVWVKQEVK